MQNNRTGTADREMAESIWEWFEDWSKAEIVEFKLNASKIAPFSNTCIANAAC